MNPLRVIKLGGSLLDLPDLPDRFSRYRKKLALEQPSQQVEHLLLVVGGGSAADVVRHYDKLHHLGDHHGHWLAVRAMAFNAHCVAHLLASPPPARSLQDCQRIWQTGQMAVVEPVAWLQYLEQQGVDVPHRWQFTSDSIAALLAVHLGARRLTLLKSALPSGVTGLAQAASAWLVDMEFPRVAAGLEGVELVNLRDDAFPVSCWTQSDKSG